MTKIGQNSQKGKSLKRTKIPKNDEKGSKSPKIGLFLKKEENDEKESQKQTQKRPKILKRCVYQNQNV
jgi:hypothetical protein